MGHVVIGVSEEEQKQLNEAWTDAKSGVPLRPVLQSFAEVMEAKLKKNDHKTSWRGLPVEALFRLLMVEIEEFKVAHEFLSKDEARNELIDVANFRLILHDRLGMEK